MSYTYMLTDMLVDMKKYLPIETFKRGLDAAFDVWEDEAEKSETHWDNAIVLPVLKAMRIVASIPEFEDTNKKPEMEK